VSELREGGVTKLIGIEPAPALAAKALEHYDKIIVSRLKDMDAPDIEFSCCDHYGDVLEYMVDPWHALGQLRRLAPNGTRLMISTPNIQWAGVLVPTSFWCRFDYSDEGGVMECEDFRWFTRRTLHSDLHTHGRAPVRWAGPMYPKLAKVDRVTLRQFSDALRHHLHVEAVAT
jgi:hypothetical protein